MGQKTNLRSFRYSDEVAAILDAQEGKSVNDKFENLVLFCYHKVEQRQKDLDRINEDIRKRREMLYDLQRATEQLAKLERDIQAAQHYFSIVERGAKQIAEAVEEDRLVRENPRSYDTERDIIREALRLRMEEQ